MIGSIFKFQMKCQKYLMPEFGFALSLSQQVTLLRTDYISPVKMSTSINHKENKVSSLWDKVLLIQLRKYFDLCTK